MASRIEINARSQQDVTQVLRERRGIRLLLVQSVFVKRSLKNIIDLRGLWG